ncbi:aldehyde dehydrogenase family protein [Microbacterium sp. MYb62]|uniref:aldehyde dehydrogenase family protein n=1 Tax=Microbacterium sp. MYb62 TaxID=1848690 RepID=UPI000CFDBC56|nr:aldehyde dehydrogenase family protein [Microbacterium sp. MYb62]PRB08580.1 aldehyde dehydrogenase (NADP(+)) [Microbacterium sp. MYb62]
MGEDETSTPDDVKSAAAAAAASGWERVSRRARADILDRIAVALEEDRPALVDLAHEETNLAPARLAWEVGRAAEQLRFVAEVVREGGYLEVTIERSDGETPAPGSDLRRMLRPIGAVAVFGASNFPFAFSVIGNDTAAALAAGAPVVVKGHPAHPRLSRRLAVIVREVLADARAPVDALVLVEGFESGIALVRHPLIRAAAFTGSTAGGRALFDAAVSRPDPIPFYGELGSVNPVVISPAAAAGRAGEIGAGLAGVLARDGGQACTKPGLVFLPSGSAIEAEVEGALRPTEPQRLLTPGISRAFDDGFDMLARRADTEVLLAGRAEGDASLPRLVATDLASFLADPSAFQQECFGPMAVLVRYPPDAWEAELPAALGLLEGSLTATLWGARDAGAGVADDEAFAAIAAILAHGAGRVVFDEWPLAVPISWAQHHGGPWPSTVGSVHSSVGATSLRRFLVPVAYQNAPERMLPPELRAVNPTGAPRRIDGGSVA